MYDWGFRYAPPFAQLVESPTAVNGIAMQIDTWNRDKMNLTGSPFVPGPHPRNSLAPTTGPDAIYSGTLLRVARAMLDCLLLTLPLGVVPVCVVVWHRRL